METKCLVVFALLLVALVSASAPGNGTTDKPPSQRRIRIIERTSKRQITAPVDPSAPFSCNNRFPGYYADIGSGCQVFYMCTPEGLQYTNFCGSGTIFNQQALVCDHWYNYDCKRAETDYAVNKILLPFIVRS